MTKCIVIPDKSKGLQPKRFAISTISERHFFRR